jgi:two-component system, cell cycle response regulator DivK
MKSRKKVLIVEDVLFNLDLVVQLLEEDYEILTARDGESAILITENERPDLVLMDMSLPKVNGWDATRRIKSNPELRDIPVIGLSAHAMSGDAEKALEAGCDDYLTKPLDEDDLFDKMRKYIRR